MTEDEMDVAVENTVAAALEALEDIEREAGSPPAAIVLYRYKSREDFDRAGGAGRYGCTWSEHCYLIEEAADILHEEGYPVEFRLFEGKLEEPTNLHEGTAEERNKR